MTDAQTRNLGALIRNARIAQGLSYRALAALTEVPLVSLKRFEDGVYRDPSPVQIARIAEVLQIDPARIDRVSRGHLADSMPTMRTYFRSKQKLSPEALDEVERAVAEIRAKYTQPATSNETPPKKGGRP